MYELIHHDDWKFLPCKISFKRIPHTGNTRPSRTCVIKEYRYYTICLSKYHGLCQYHRSMSIGSKMVFFKRSRKVKNGQYGQKWSIWSKPDKKNCQKMVKNGQKRSKTVTKWSTMVYHGVRKVYHGVRKVYHGDRKVNHGVRKVCHGHGRSVLLKGFPKTYHT